MAEVAAARLLARDWSGRQVQGVHGPEDLTYEQVAAIVAEATVGRCAQSGFSTTRCVRGYAVSGNGEKQGEGRLRMSIGRRENFTPEQERSVHTTTPSAWVPGRTSACVRRWTLERPLTGVYARPFL
ncbi:MAG: hypothetical protein M3310_08485 [Actinomycetota bacterium]|nr:hypothetical protein [Actinomycetota bacterium]